MKSITISEFGIKVNGYPLGQLESLGFEYAYLYYEPEAENLFKLARVGQELVKVDLTDSEKQICSDFCDGFVPPVVPEPAISIPPEDPLVFFASAVHHSKKGQKRRSELVSGEEYEITYEQLNSFPAEHFAGQVQYVWDPVSSTPKPCSADDQRRFEYYKDLKMGDQLDAIWKFIRASGIALPAETQAVLNKIDEIKTNIPKV